MNTLITIGLPCYNAENYIYLALTSIINQTYPYWKLVIIDDNSTDNSRQIIQGFLKDDRILYIHDNQNLGISVRLNQMISMCNTKYFARMDADDVMDINRLEEQVKFMEENPSVDVVGTHVYSISDKGEILGRRGGEVPLNIKGAMWHCVFIHPTIMAKTNWFIKNKYDESCARMEDYELWFRTFKDSTFKIIQKPLLFYREIDGNNRKKYWLSKKNAYMIVKRNTEISIFHKFFFISLEISKGLIYVFISLIGFESSLLSTRFSKIKESEKFIALNKLKISTN